jgi:hypothetical protein
MRRTLLRAALLCLAVAGIVVLTATPAMAAGSCDCHTAVPPTGGAPAAHVPSVAAVTDCVVCHYGWTAPPHPEVAGDLELRLSGRSTDAGYRLHGRLEYRKAANLGGWIVAGQPGVAVYLQRRLWGATAFTDLPQVTTGAKGGFTQTVASPSPFAAYRAVAQGHVGPTGLDPSVTGLFMPITETLLPTPHLTLAIHGRFSGGSITRARITLGRTITVKGSVAPADLGGRVTIRVQKNIKGYWVRYFTAKRAITAKGTYVWKWTPQRRGVYRIAAEIPADADHDAARTGFIPFRGWQGFSVI